MSDFFDETCGTCVHFHPPAEGAPNGSCWRYPPHPLGVPVQAPEPAVALPKGRHQGAQGAAGMGIMTFPVRPPVTGDTLACGEWEPPDNGEEERVDPQG